MRSAALVCVRLFLIPEYNDCGLKMNFNELREFAIEIDRFVTKSNPQPLHVTKTNSSFFSVEPGLSSVTRKSEDSSIVRIRDKKKTKNIFCRSGWPGHLLIPKGDPDGKKFILFGILTDYLRDHIYTKQDGDGCEVGSLYYGLFRGKFPDKRPMGFPFDRRAHFHIEQLTDFLLPNMKCTSVTIRNKLEILPP